MVPSGPGTKKRPAMMIYATALAAATVSCTSSSTATPPCCAHVAAFSSSSSSSSFCGRAPFARRTPRILPPMGENIVAAGAGRTTTFPSVAHSTVLIPIGMAADDIIDAEIVPDNVDDDGNNSNQDMTTIVDASLDAAPEWKNIVVEFVERTPSGGNLKVIPCRMPFTVDLDGVTYSVGVPYEDTVAILTDGPKDGQGEGKQVGPVPIDPDDDANEEIFQLAATALVKNMGEELRLRRTPRVLTVRGDLRGITSKYMTDGKVADADALLDESDEDEKFLDDFFTAALGEGYEEKFGLDGDDDDDDDDDDMDDEMLLKLFDVPGLGTEEDDEEGISNMLKDMMSGGGGEDVVDKKKKKSGNMPLDAEISIGADGEDGEATKALPLFPFAAPDGTNYAFVQLAKNPLLVGREDPDIDPTQRLLLSAEEAAVVVPRLEERFREEMGEAGLLDEP